MLWPVNRIAEVFIPKLIVKRFQSLCHGQLELDILFVELTAQIASSRLYKQ